MGARRIGIISSNWLQFESHYKMIYNCQMLLTECDITIHWIKYLYSFLVCVFLFLLDFLLKEAICFKLFDSGCCGFVTAVISCRVCLINLSSILIIHSNQYHTWGNATDDSITIMPWLPSSLFLRISQYADNIIHV